jgi:glycosyltransferase involved in cell wall biosynthesis
VKVFLSPHIALHSPAMVRIANALTKYLPPHYQVVSQQEQADLCIFYPISYDWSKLLAECLARGQEYALIQCCFRSDREVENKIQFELWKPWWKKSIITWSYLGLLAGHEYDEDALEIPFYHAPLGVDEAFTLPTVTHPKRDYIVTTGTVHGQGQEAILECWEAARQCNLDIVHIGQFPQNLVWPHSYAIDGSTQKLDIVSGVTDQTLRGIYQNARWICSLRYVEGFELPALESLSCGTRSIVFTQPATTKWYWGYADFVPELSGQELIDQLVSKFSGPYEAISRATIDEVRSKFNWGILCWRFWSIVEKEMNNKDIQKRILESRKVVI